MDVQQLIHEHGAWSYLITFAWTFLEGETFVLVMGFAAAQGLIHAPLLLASAWLGSFCGDQCYFWVGRHFGLKMLEQRPAWRVRVDRALGWLRRFDVWFILSFRFIYGVRNFSSFALGISGIAWQRFFLFNFIAAGLWATVFVGAGYLCGHALHSVLGDIAKEVSIALLGVFVLVVAAVFVVNHLKQRRRNRLAGAPGLRPPSQARGS